VARSSPAVRIGLNPMARPSHWPDPTRLATAARMRVWFTYACNNNWLIILANKEENFPGRASAGGEVEGDGRMTLETGGWANISTFPSFFCVSPFSLVSFFLISLPFPFWVLLLLTIMERAWSYWLEEHGRERGAPVGACCVLLFTAGAEERRSQQQSRGGESVL